MTQKQSRQEPLDLFGEDIILTIMQFLPFTDKLQYRVVNSQIEHVAKHLEQFSLLHKMLKFIRDSAEDHPLLLVFISNRLHAKSQIRRKPIAELNQLTTGITAGQEYIYAEYMLKGHNFRIVVANNRYQLQYAHELDEADVIPAFEEEMVITNPVFTNLLTHEPDVLDKFIIRPSHLGIHKSQQTIEAEKRAEEFLQTFGKHLDDYSFAAVLRKHVAKHEPPKGPWGTMGFSGRDV